MNKNNHFVRIRKRLIQSGVDREKVYRYLQRPDEEIRKAISEAIENQQ